MDRHEHTVPDNMMKKCGSFSVVKLEQYMGDGRGAEDFTGVYISSSFVIEEEL